MTEENMPAVTDADLKASGLPSLMKMSPGLALYFNDAVYNRVKQIAGHMAKAEGVTPRHLLGKPEACFAVATRAITWNLDPQSVCAATWQTPSGQIGYEAKLIVAIMESSGALDGRVAFEYKGDWSKLRGKFKQETSGKGNKYFVADWAKELEKDLSIVVSCQIRGETTRREEEFWLEELWPRNSTLWATRPRQQATYAVSRAFANIATPGLILGLPFDIDPGALGDAAEMLDVTPPPPKKTEFTRDVRTDGALQGWIAKANFAGTIEEIDSIATEGVKEISPDHHARWQEVVEARAAAIKMAFEQKRVAEEVSDGEQQEDIQAQPDPDTTPADEGPSDNDLIHQWGDRLAAVKDVKDVADVRADGLKGLPEHLHVRWNDGCDARAKAIAEKPRAKNGGTKAKDTEKESPLQRGKRLLPRVDTPDDILELHDSIMEELSTKGARVEWEDLCVTRLKEVIAP